MSDFLPIFLSFPVEGSEKFQPEMNNLVGLPQLTEESILGEVEARFKADSIYTYVGDLLLAVNPFKPLPIYGKAFKDLFLPTKAAGGGGGEPHIYAIAQRAYKNLTNLHQSQCCLISGESGAGKTETAKFLLNHLLNFQSDGAKISELERRILESQPLLEAFGNAKTTLNDNSSRFGKYIVVQFNRGGTVVGAEIHRYLLEKSRLVAHNDGEEMQLRRMVQSSEPTPKQPEQRGARTAVRNTAGSSSRVTYKLSTEKLM
eukprot:gene15338-20993_t